MDMLDWGKLLSAKRLGMESLIIDNQDYARSQFQRDYDRIIFSSPFRRLQNKTQVFPLPGAVFVHNRLTHSLEVSCVGRSLGNMVSSFIKEKNELENPVVLNDLGSIVAASCLAHDLGNPPFGHSGEDAISSFFVKNTALGLQQILEEQEFNDFTHFEGNANAFRLLTNTFTGRRRGGFALTYSTLATVLKYPCTSNALVKGNSPYEKYGVFKADLKTMQKVLDELGLKKIQNDEIVYARHPLVFLMEAADDICYQIIDLEDAHRLSILTGEQTKDLMMNFFDPVEDALVIKEIESLYSQIDDVNEQINILRSRVINRLIEGCVKVFQEHYQDIMNCNYFSSLIYDLSGSLKKAIDEVKAVSAKKIYQHRSVVEVQVGGYRVLGALLEEFTEAVLYPRREYSKMLLRLLPDQLRLDSECSPYEKVLSIVDFVAGMTDIYALELFRKIRGISFSVGR